MQKLQSDYELSGVKPSSLGVEFLVFLDVKHEVAAVQIFHHEEQVRLTTQQTHRQTDRRLDLRA